MEITLPGWYLLTGCVSDVEPDIHITLICHAGYLSNAYWRYSREQVAEFYLKGEPVITIMGPADYR